jgi:prevent-host-death family protein
MADHIKDKGNDDPVNIYDAKTQLSQLVARAEGGEEIVIARGGKPVAKLVPYFQRVPDRVPGRMKGRIQIFDNFDDPIPELENVGMDDDDLF